MEEANSVVETVAIVEADSVENVADSVEIVVEIAVEIAVVTVVVVDSVVATVPPMIMYPRFKKDVQNAEVAEIVVEEVLAANPEEIILHHQEEGVNIAEEKDASMID